MRAFKKIFAVAMTAVLSAGVAVPAIAVADTWNCAHTFSEIWDGDTKNHWHPSDCGHDIVTDMAPHSFKDGSCMVCGEVYSEVEQVHVHTFTQSDCDELNHWKTADCGHDIITAVEPHSYVGGVCTVCGYTQPVNHIHTYSEKMEYNTKYHWKVANCGHEIVSGMALHVIVDGVCECGYSVEVEPPSSDFTVYGGYEESLYAEWDATDVGYATAYYRESGASVWTQVDKELVRMTGEKTARVDVVGIKAGTYDLKVTENGVDKTASGINVTAYDRSGYAHFKATEGVGAYDNDGQPKEGAQIIYVTNETKNSVKATINGKTYTGLISILNEGLAKSNVPAIIRIIGTIKAAAWNPINYSASTVTPDYIIANTPSTTGNTLQKQKYTMQELIDGGFNTLKIDEANGVTELEGLYSLGYMNYDSSKKEFDSCWNNCTVGDSSKSYPENVTVEGIGSGSGLYQWGITFKYAKSIEVRNLTFDDYTEDACSFEGNTNSTTYDGFDSRRIWLHNCTFYEGVNEWDVCNEQDKNDGDGSTDFKKCSYVTLAYNKYVETHKTGLIGGGKDHMTANVTFHHNYYVNCKARLPLARQANMHMYNNYYYGTTDTCLSVRSNGYAFVEYCYFENASKPLEVRLDSGSTAMGAIKYFNCYFDGTKEPTSGLTSAGNVQKVTSRETAVENWNTFNQNFDTDPDDFYYDAVNNRTDAENLITNLADIPAYIRAHAGAK